MFEPIMTEEAAIRKQIDLRHQSLVNNDRTLMASLLHEQYFYVNATGQSYDKPAFLASFFDQGEPHDSTDTRFKHIDITDNIATVACEVEGSFTVAGRPYEGIFQIYHTMIKVDDTWKFLAGHFGS